MSIRVEALHLGERLDLQGLGPRLASRPLLIAAGDAKAVLFRYGVAVIFDASDHDRDQLLTRLRERITGALPEPEIESLEILLEGQSPPVVADGVLHLEELGPPQMQAIAEVLGKSVVLASFEDRMSGAFGAVEPLAQQLSKGQSGRRVPELLRHIGDSLLIEHKLVGLAEVSDKPELLWEQPELDRIYVPLADEYELGERTEALERKLTLIRTTVETVLELLHHRRSLRVEWYIVALIVIEIMLTLYAMFVAGGH